MKRHLWRTAFLLAALAGLLAPAQAWAETTGRWLHVRVEKTGEDAESVRVNLPLKVAEKVLPAIKADELRHGRLSIHHARIRDVDLRAILEAIRELEDGEFVTVQSNDEKVRVAKEAGYLLVKVDERGKKMDKVDIKIPFPVVDALLSAGEDELDILAAIRALNEHGDAALVTVESENETVRIWVDSKSTTE